MLKLDPKRIRHRLLLAMAIPGNWPYAYRQDVRALRAALNRAVSLLKGTDSQLLDVLRQMEEAPSLSNAAVLAERRLRSILGIKPDGPLPKRPPGYPGL